ncbi:hypothetical protein BDN70DRAFT_881985 [Pholiota conissans]|uniref:Transmembrane protein n=1 Tax=Pholiota conissans TaxID=109636 RepID=A0A9P5YVY8_9AGAR|nr:hypothetical protein BDN70DRAFT_881985 [Pholiota conissans]
MTVFLLLAFIGTNLLLESEGFSIDSTSVANIRHVNEPPIVTSGSATLSARSTTSDVVHDKIFIPTIATMGALVVVALVCCYMIVMNRHRAQTPRDRNWAVPTHVAPDRVYNPDTTKSGAERDSQNLSAAGRRMSKAQRKSPPPFLPGPSNITSQPFGPGQAPYPYASQPGYQYGTSDAPNATTYTPNAQQYGGYWTQPEPQRMSMLSSAQSATEVGSDSTSPKTKPYTPAGGYGFSGQNVQNVAPQEFGAQRSQPSTVGSQNFNPYDGIDPNYTGTQTGKGKGGSSSQRQGPS